MYEFGISTKERNELESYLHYLSSKNKEGEVELHFNPAIYNCTDVVVEAMYAAGVVSDKFEAHYGIIATPGNLKRQLDIKYQSQTEMPSWYEFYDNSVIKKFKKDIQKYYVKETY